jgi:hypothetical protein
MTPLSLVLHQRYTRRQIYREFGIDFDQLTCPAIFGSAEA